MLIRNILRIVLFIMIGSSIICAQDDVAGYWAGKIKVLSTELDFSVKIIRTGDSLSAAMNIPAQNLKNYPLANLSYAGNNLKFDLIFPGGKASFDGLLEADSIKGTFLQSGFKGSFYLLPGIEPREEVSEKKPEEEKLPYNHDEVTFNDGDIKLAGTFTYPKTGEKFPAVVFITGSGPQNRDEEVFGFKIFRIIADHLTKNGIATLRYDDRGVGGSTGNTMQSTTEDFAHDALSAVDYLKTRKEVDKTKIGLIGHSEGGIVAPLAATISNDVSFIVLLSGTGVKGADILIEQQKLILQKSGVDPAFIESNLALQRKINQALLEGKDLNELKPEMKKLAEKDFDNLNAETKSAIADRNAYLDNMVNGQIMQFNNNWFKFFVKYDPAPTLENVACPVLMTFGGLDLQVPESQNRPVMEAALKAGGNKNFKTIVYPKANHLYQEALTGSPSEYASLPKDFVKGFLDDITNWIKEITK